MHHFAHFGFHTGAGAWLGVLALVAIALIASKRPTP